MPEPSLCLPATLVTGDGAAYVRGPVTTSLRTDAIGVDAEVEAEVLETVAGEMQQPTGAERVAWYKKSARLG